MRQALREPVLVPAREREQEQSQRRSL